MLHGTPRHVPLCREFTVRRYVPHRSTDSEDTCEGVCVTQKHNEFTCQPSLSDLDRSQWDHILFVRYGGTRLDSPPNITHYFDDHRWETSFVDRHRETHGSFLVTLIFQVVFRRPLKENVVTQEGPAMVRLLLLNNKTRGPMSEYRWGNSVTDSCEFMTSYVYYNG